MTSSSAECTDGMVILHKGTPHETRDKPQELRATPRRLEIEGEQEAAESVMTAERTSGTLKMWNEVTDIDRMAALD